MELSWGKPTIKISKLTSNIPGERIDIPTPVENSTKLTTSKGTKKEAKIEGGAVEAVKYGRNNYSFEFEIRAGKGRQKPVEDDDGVIEGEYRIELQPEDKTVPGIIIDKAVLSVEDTFDTENGSKWKYTCDVLRPQSGRSVKFEVVNFPDAGSLKVVISGDDGAGRWKLSTEGANDWHNSGVSIAPESTSPVTIQYKPVSGKTLPSQTTATPQKGKEVVVNATYTPGK